MALGCNQIKYLNHYKYLDVNMTIDGHSNDIATRVGQTNGKAQ